MTSLSEEMIGKLYNNGLIREYYNEEEEDLKIELTSIGFKKIKEILKEDKYQNFFFCKLGKMNHSQRNNFFIKMKKDFNEFRRKV